MIIWSWQSRSGSDASESGSDGHASQNWNRPIRMRRLKIKLKSSQPGMYVGRRTRRTVALPRSAVTVTHPVVEPDPDEAAPPGVAMQVP